MIHLYAAYDLTPSRIGHEQDEVMTVLRMPFADAIARVESGEITDAKTVGALLLAARRNAKPR